MWGWGYIVCLFVHKIKKSRGIWKNPIAHGEKARPHALEEIVFAGSRAEKRKLDLAHESFLSISSLVITRPRALKFFVCGF